MPHADSDHGLRVQLATALRQLEEEKAMAGRLGDRAWAAEQERDDLRGEVKRLREATTRLIAVLDSPFVNVEATATTAVELTEAMSQACAALAAPAAGGD